MAAGARRSRPGRFDGTASKVVALAGGVGAARFLRGLVEVVDVSRLTVVVNTGDDIERHGLWICPDIDSVVYGLAGLHDEERGWGLRDETWRCLERLGALGEQTWFQLGDRDLATHIWRTHRRRGGASLSEITAAQCAALGVRTRVLPMSDDVVSTRVSCEDFGELHLQEWLVRERCLPRVTALRFAGADDAQPAPGVLDALAGADALIVCPSNPLISIGPILAVPGIRAAVREVPRTIAVTPIVEGAALRGPAARMLDWQGVEASAAGVARLYADFLQTMVVDERDAALVADVAAAGVHPALADTVMTDLARSTALARAVCGELADGEGRPMARPPAGTRPGTGALLPSGAAAGAP